MGLDVHFPSSVYRNEAGVRPCTITFNTCMGWVLSRVMHRGHCGAFEGLREEAKSMGLKSPGPRPRYRCLEACCMKRLNVYMCVGVWQE